MLICLTAVMINLTAMPWTKKDMTNFSVAQQECSKTSECLKSFQKRDFQFYRALCGEKQEFDRKALDKAELDVILYELRHLSLEEKKIKLRAIGLEVK